MQRRVLALFALVLVSAVGFVLWRAFAPSAEPSAAASAVARFPESTNARAASSTELARAPEVAPKLETPRPAAVETVNAPEQRVVAAQGGIEFKVDVTWPADVPVDEKAELVVQGRKTTDVFARLPLERGGEYVVVLPKGETKGRVLVEARYLFLETPLKLDPDKRSKRLACEPVVGAWLHGRVIVPERADPADRDLSRCRVVMRSMRVSTDGSGSRSFNGDSGSASIDADGRYELGGLSSAMRHWISADFPGFVRLGESFESPKAGVAIEYDLPLMLGVGFAGRVVDERGEPVAKARVTCVTEDDNWNHQVDRGVDTAADGTFSLRGIEPQRMKLYVKCAGFVSCAGEMREFADGDFLRDLALTLRRGNTLAGIVKWSDGRPADGAAIRVVDLSDHDEPQLWSTNDSAPAAKADTLGAFEVTGLGVGPFNLEASATQILKTEGRKKERKPWRASHDTVEAGARDIVLVLEPPRALVGTVRDDLGKPVTKFTVSARPLGADGDTEWRKQVSALVRDDKGAFRLEKVHPGSWDVSIEAAGYEDGESKRVLVEDEELPIEFTCPRAASLAGVVFDPDGKPIAGASVSARVPGDGSWNRSDCNTDVHGAFACADQTPGKLSLWASHPDWAASEPQDVDLAPGDALAGLTLHLRVGGGVDVEVLGAPGLPRKEHRVNLNLADRRELGNLYEQTDETGHAVFAHVAPGHYDISVWRNEQSGRGSERGTVDVVEGRTASVVIGRADALVIRVSGRITAGGKGVSHVGANFSLADDTDGRSHRSGRSDSDGHYEVVLDRAGRWNANFQGAGASQSFELDIPAAPTFVQDVVLGTGSIAGKLRDPRGAAVPGMYIALQYDDVEHRDQQCGWVQTDAKGRFRFEHVSPGTYRVETWGADDSSEWAKASRSGIEVAVGQAVDGADLALTPGAKLDGRVTGKSPAEGVWILVDDLDGNRVGGTPAEDDGTFEVSGLPQTRVRVSAQSDGLRAPPVEVDLSDGKSRHVELRLAPTATATLHLVDASGGAINGRAKVTSLASGKTFDYGGDARAEHVFEDLLPGKYRASATTEDGAKGEVEFDLAEGASKSVEVRLEK
ncbi:MAG: carboxypeptidase regulatory-like domain-containing protein [Planctomycetes bacterium]|nr:carboxypeptidase regulatory-like domain-containing protein [Planctomycetota bacterium]